MNARCLVLTMLVFGSVVATARGQVDRRVESGQPLPGHALDASPQVGTGGFNSNLGAQRNQLINSANSIVTGNVSGLGGFRDPGVVGAFGGSLRNSFNVTGLSGLTGTTVVSDPSVFQGNLPSSDLSFFNRRGFSLQDYRSSGGVPGQYAGQYTPYYGGSQTVFSAGALQRGLGRQGSGPGGNSFVNPNGPVTSGFGNTATLPNGASDPLDRRVPQNSVDQPVQSVTQSGPTYQQPYWSAIQSPLFGPSPFDARPDANYLEQLYAARVGAKAQQPSDKIAEPTGVAGPATAPPEPALAANPPGAAIRQTPVTGSGTSPDGSTGDDSGAPPGAGRDPFTDMLAAVRGAMPADTTTIDGSRGATGGLAPPLTPSASESRMTGLRQLAVETALTARSGTPSATRRGEFAQRLDRAARWANEVLSRPVTSLAAPTATDDLNRFMQAADQAMAAGEYYRAAGQYRLASSLSTDNPLPWLGQGLALAAAGSYISASHSLGVAVQRFPQIVAFNLDLASLAHSRDVFDRRRADLERQLGRSESYELRFLLGFLEYYSGVKDIGLANLRRAASRAPAGSVIAQFPELLLGKPNPRAGMQAGQGGSASGSPQ
ncbi:MAG: hypothetical protein U1A27_04750 [Phycisphaerae bacterium]